MARPHRLLVLGGRLPVCFDASEEEKRGVFLPRFKALLFEVGIGRPFWVREE